MIHFEKDLTDQDKNFLEFVLARLDKNYLDSDCECSDQQHKLAEFLEDILLKIYRRNDGLLLDVLKKVFVIDTENFFNE